MSDVIKSLRVKRLAAWDTFQTELARLHALGEQAPRSGTVPPGWYEQIAAVSKAFRAYEQVNAAYMKAMHCQEQRAC